MASKKPKEHVNVIPREQLIMLEEFISLMDNKPEMYKLPELKFYRDYVEKKLKGTIPKTDKEPPNYDPLSSDEEDGDEIPKFDPKPPAEEKTEEPKEEEEEEIVESDVELVEEDGLILDEDEDMPEYGDESLSVTDDMMDQANDKRGEAMRALSDGNLDAAINLFTEAIKLNPTSAGYYAKRASIYVKSKKPKKAIHDCNKAVELNIDNAQAYKWRGMANKLLGRYEEAFKDLTTACRLDYDDQASEQLKIVTPNAKKIMDHRRKYERLREERELTMRKKKVQAARAAYEKQKEQSSSAGAGADGGFAGFPGAFPGSEGGMPGMPDLTQILQDPELLQAFQDPEVSKAFQDVAMNPANISKYQNNPKVQQVINKMAKKFGGGAPGGAGGMPGGMPGGFPPGSPGGFPPGGAGGFPGGFPSTPDVD